MKKTGFGLLIGIVIVFAVGINAFAVLWLQADDEAVETIVEEIAEDEGGEPEEIDDKIQENEFLFTLDEGMRADYASNPMVTYQDDEKLILAYEDRAEALMFAPGEDAPLIVTYDGLEFEEIEDRTGLSTHPQGVLIDDLYHKYIFYPSEGVKHATSEDNLDYVAEDTIALEVYAEDASDAREFGVSTFFADDEGGVVLLFNSTDEDGAIVVNRAYASSDDLSTLEVTDRDILDGTLESEIYADPHTVVLDDGTVVLIIMNQDGGPAAPHGRQGWIHAYTSDDYGMTWTYAGELFGWDDFEEFDVYSLNDPKIVQMWDGTFRVYVAAMIPDPENPSDDPRYGYKWILVSAAGELE